MSLLLEGRVVEVTTVQVHTQIGSSLTLTRLSGSKASMPSVGSR